MNNKIKYELTINGLRLGFRILWMDERFRSKQGQGTNEFKTLSEFEISSCGSPEIHSQKCVYLRGHAVSSDYETCRYFFNNKENLYKFIKNLDEALDDWAENWEGFKEDKNNNLDLEKRIEKIENDLKFYSSKYRFDKIT